MLKIKEDRIKDLEKLGFKKKKTLGGGYVYTYDVYNHNGAYISIEIVLDRTLAIYISDSDSIWLDEELEILYKLFANDMFEKVVEDEI